MDIKTTIWVACLDSEEGYFYATDIGLATVEALLQQGFTKFADGSRNELSPFVGKLLISRIH